MTRISRFHSGSSPFGREGTGGQPRQRSLRDYGTVRLEWADVERRLDSASVYWIASTRRDGRPHVIPRDGMWLDGGLYYGGSPKTVHYRNITHNPHVAVHIGDGQEAIIVEGAVEIEKPTEKMAARLSDESFAKYPQYGRLEPSLYMGGVSVLRPRRLLAWTTFTENATRFKFE
jgi:nitroimidazol reductase NimA-like FMN-containing flavoprotein (pyridoxamine 5'-phosphate oxidase superfamily)